MKKWFKILIWSIGSILTVFVFVLIGMYFWLSTKWADFYTEKEMQEMARAIELAKPLPDNFYKAYELIYPEQRNRSLVKMSFQAVYALIMNKSQAHYKQCNCIKATCFFENKVPINYNSWSAIIIAFGFEKYSSEGKCLDFVCHKLGADSIAHINFSKPLGELSVEQCKELVLRLERPTHYEKRPDLLKKKLEEFE